MTATLFIQTISVSNPQVFFMRVAMGLVEKTTRVHEQLSFTFSVLRY